MQNKQEKPNKQNNPKGKEVSMKRHKALCIGLFPILLGTTFLFNISSGITVKLGEDKSVPGSPKHYRIKSKGQIKGSSVGVNPRRNYANRLAIYAHATTGLRAVISQTKESEIEAVAAIPIKVERGSSPATTLYIGMWGEMINPKRLSIEKEVKWMYIL